MLSNVTVDRGTQAQVRLASYRDDKLGFYATSDSPVAKVETAPDVAGKRVIVGSGTNQESILLRWHEENKKNGLKPVEFQYYDDGSPSQLDGGWPLKASVPATTKKGNGFAAAAQAGLNHLIQDGNYARILERWGLGAEASQKSELNPAGLPKK